MGILTSPKLMLPFQIARAIQFYFVSIQRNAWVIPPAHRPSAQRIVSPMRAQGCAEDSAHYVNLGSACQIEIPAQDAAQLKKRISVSSIKLFGQDAPAVMPITAGPLGNQKCET